MGEAVEEEQQEQGRRLKSVAVEIGGSMKNFADLLGVLPQTLSKYANGTLRIGPKLLRKLNELGVDTDWILNGPDEEAVGVAQQMRAVNERIEAIIEELKRMNEILEKRGGGHG